jgi:poly-gamma-glutamate capsule biosynthesis protein CapA/YwtB (metallophosphatase superfamily)
LTRSLAAVALACAVVALAPSAAARPHAASTFTFAAVGDIVMGSMPNLPPHGGAGFFKAVAPRLSADVVLGNLEGTLSTHGSAKCGTTSTDCYSFHTPPSYARRLEQAGFTVMNVANNHALDFGPVGQHQTLAALRKVGLAWTGRPGQIAYQRVGAIRVALLGFAPYKWAQSLTDLPAARRLVRKAAANADVVVVTMHAGAEGVEHQHVTPGMETYLGEKRGNPIAFAHAVVNAGADLVVGSGPHVLRGMEWYKGRLIAYSLGNFGGYKVFHLGGPLSTSGILHVTLRADGSFVKGGLVATRLTTDGIPALDRSGTARRLVRTLSRQDFGARAVAVSVTGRLR